MNTVYIMNNKQYYTWEEVEQHNTEESMWIVANNNIYDVTKFYKKHPGGSYLVKSKAGTDVTKHKKYHSLRAQIIWKQYHIGYILQNTKCCFK